MIRKIKDWWRGEYQQPTLAQVLGEEEEGPEFRRPWLAQLCHSVVGFLAKHWVQLITWLIAVAGIATIWLVNQ